MRESETRPGTLSLSVRGENNEQGAAVIKHFCIRTKSETGEVFISNKIEFPNVHELISYYRQNKGLFYSSISYFLAAFAYVMGINFLYVSPIFIRRLMVLLLCFIKVIQYCMHVTHYSSSTIYMPNREIYYAMYFTTSRR